KTPSHRTRNICMVQPLKSENQLSPKSANGAVKELPKAVAVKVVLNVPRIGMIEQVEHAKSDFDLSLLGKREHELSVCLKIEVVEIACGLRSHVGGVQRLTSYLITAGNLKLAVKISPAVRQRQEIAACCCFRVENQVIDSVPLLVGNSNQQFLHHLTVKFNVP